MEWIVMGAIVVGMIGAYAWLIRDVSRHYRPIEEAIRRRQQQ